MKISGKFRCHHLTPNGSGFDVHLMPVNVGTPFVAGNPGAMMSVLCVTSDEAAAFEVDGEYQITLAIK